MRTVKAVDLQVGDTVVFGITRESDDKIAVGDILDTIMRIERDTLWVSVLKLHVARRFTDERAGQPPVDCVQYVGIESGQLVVYTKG